MLPAVILAALRQEETFPMKTKRRKLIGKVHKRNRWITGAGMLAAALILQLLARFVPGFGQWYAVTVYPALVLAVGGIFGLVPFSAAEVGLYLLVPMTLWYGGFHIHKGRSGSMRKELGAIGSGAFCLIGFLAFSYTACCGINYYRQPFSSYLDLEVRDSSAEELEALCCFLKEQLEETAREILKERGTLDPGIQTRKNFPKQARADMKKLGKSYPQLDAPYPVPKPVFISEILSIQSLSGVYAPFTIEANYNRHMTAYNIPHTACHELSHLNGFMREEEANFIGYLACVASDSLYSRYSGYATGFVYANNALFSQKPEQAFMLYSGLPEAVLEDFRENNAFWKRYEGRISEASAKINDTYLKANSQTEGVKSYGQVVDLLLAYYRADMGQEAEEVAAD